MSPTARITPFEAGISAIDTEFARPQLDASHLIVEDGRAAFVDTGANNAVPLLLDALSRQGLGVADVEFVFLTHVHLDHAGGAGRLMRALPNARCVVHPRGAPHMIDPAKIWAGTEAVYGAERAREIYGVLEPIDAARVVVADDEQWFDLNGRTMQALFTEGHARHHYVLHDPASRGVFTGDSFGISYRELDTAAGAFIFPTSTPIDFDPAAAHASIDRIMALKPERLFLTHYSEVTELERLSADMHECIDAYVDIAERCGDEEGRVERIEARLFDYYDARLDAHGAGADRDTRWSILGMDVTLNAMGLDVWLKRRARK